MVEEHDATLESCKIRHDSLVARVDKLETRMHKAETNQQSFEVRFERLLADMSHIKETVDCMVARLDIILNAPHERYADVKETAVKAAVQALVVALVGGVLWVLAQTQ